MELEEHGHQDGDDSVQHVSDLDDYIGDQHLLVLLFPAKVVSVKRPLDRF